MDKNMKPLGSDAVNEKLPVGKNLVYAIQHVFVMVAGAVAVPIIIGGRANLSDQQIQFLVSCSLFAAGIATVLQNLGVRNFVGVRVPVIEGTSFAAVSTMALIASSASTPEEGLRAVAGGVLFAGLFCFLMANIFGKLLVFFPKVVTGTVVCIIGTSLFPVGIRWIQQGGSNGAAPVSHIAVAFITLLIIILANKFLKGILGNLSILFGLAGGTIVAYFLGMANFSTVADAPFVEVIKPLKYGLPIFKVDVIISLILIMLVIMTEATGNMIAVHNMAGKPVEQHNLVMGLRSSGISTMISSIFNSYPVTPFAQNVGMVSLTGVYSRFVTATAGILLILAGFFPKFAAIFAAIPKPVLGGASFVMFGVVTVGGIRTLGQVNYNGNKNAIIVAASLGMSFIPIILGNFFNDMPEWAVGLLHSGITIGCVSAIILNYFFNMFLVPADKREKVEH